jgi:hypothetical protein
MVSKSARRVNMSPLSASTNSVDALADSAWHTRRPRNGTPISGSGSVGRSHGSP